MTEVATEKPTKEPERHEQLVEILPQPVQEETIPEETPTATPATLNEDVTETTQTTENSQSQEAATSTETTGEVTQNTGVQKSVVMEMKENTKVYAETIQKIREEGTEMVLDMSESITWTIDGSKISSEPIGDIDFAAILGDSDIPEEKLKELVTGETRYIELSLAHEGEFGFDAVLTVAIDEAAEGEYANLFYYNEKTKEFEFMCAAPVNAEGKAAFNFKHASDYVIIVSEQTLETKVEMIQEERIKMQAQKEAEHKAELAAKDAPAEEPVKATGIMILIVLGSIAIVIGALLIFNRKK